MNSNAAAWIALLALSALLFCVVILRLWPKLDLLFELAAITACAARLLIPWRRSSD